MTWCVWIAIIALETIGGWVATASVLIAIRLTTGAGKEWREYFDVFSLWLGSFERIIATVLFIAAPAALTPFIGGWIVAKYAANWKRHPDDDKSARRKSLMFLIGSIVSFA